MANFRAERLFIRVAGSLDFDPNEGIDVEEFATIMVLDAEPFDRPSLQDFSFAPFDQPKWFDAAEGLKTVVAVISEMESKLKHEVPECHDHILKQIEVLRVVQEKLDMIDIKDYRFHFQVRDLD